ncbi:hypothetical protein HPB50_004300 [Hyalomma asiaticum]|uniref:Uncharacterized protein n=1 Tax=Hyalomma asiaticum TaxID=266040 RepID=A0ACB7SN21_HYAAI|nr:hypothetical protein HPB50_004300 [Hyalomma asiaticum]
MSEYRKFATRNKFGMKRKRARYNFEKCPDPAEEPSDDYLPAASSEGHGDSEVDSSEPCESGLSLTASPADGDRRSTVRHDTRMAPQAELLQRQKQAEDKLQRLAQTSAMKRKLHMSASVNDGADGPAEMEWRFFITRFEAAGVRAAPATTPAAATCSDNEASDGEAWLSTDTQQRMCVDTAFAAVQVRCSMVRWQGFRLPPKEQVEDAASQLD